MACYVISYDLRQPRRNYDDLYAAIKSYGTWARINESFWAIVTSSSAVQVRDYLAQFMDSDDRLFVMKSGREAAWQHAICEDAWLKKNL